jgi:D-xylose transport system substrate-binding protein
VVWNQAAKSVSAGAKGNSLGYSLVGENFAPGWDNTKGGTIFQQEYTANPKINATIEANDGLANAVITDLKTDGVKPNTVPTTGSGRHGPGHGLHPPGLPVRLRLQGRFTRRPRTPCPWPRSCWPAQTVPPALLNGTTVDPADSSIKEPASLLTPVWVTKANMESTVVKDNFDTASAICAIAGASVCSAAGIK